MTAPATTPLAPPSQSHEDRLRPANLLLNRNFVLLWAAYGISALGDHLSEVALLKWQNALESLDGDITQRQAVMTFVFMMPFFVLGPLFGALADKLPRRFIMIGADLIRAVIIFEMFRILAGLQSAATPGFNPATDPISLRMAVIPLIALGIFAAAFSPARLSLLPTLIQPTQLVRANALTAGLGMIATILAFYIGGILAQRYSPTVNFRLNAATFILSAICLFLIRPPRGRAAAASSSDQGLAAIVDGFRFVRTHRLVREIIIVSVVLWIGATVMSSLVPAVVKEVFRGSYEDIGIYRGMLGIGLLGGSIALTVIGPSLKSPIAISWSLKLAGSSGLLLAAGTAWHWPRPICGAALIAIGFFGAGIQVSVNAMLQRLVPNHLRGRVFGVHDLFTMAGVLASTGIIGIPDWGPIDRYIAWIMLGVSGMLLGFGIWTTRLRLGRGRWGPALTFWINLSAFHCRFWHRLKRPGLCTIPYDGPVIVAANHNSTLDPFALNAGSPNRYISYMIAAEYTKIPLFQRLLKAIDAVPVTRSGVDTASVKAALRHLSHGKCLGIFPQGGIRDPKEPFEVRDGVGLLALRSGATVIPAYIDGIEYTQGVMKPLLFRQRARVRFGPPVDLSEFKGREKDRDAYHEASQKIAAAIVAIRDSDQIA